MTDVAAQANPLDSGPASASLVRAMQSSRIAGLDFLRAVAVLLVLADHSGLYRVGPVTVFDGGFGVEMFFVISGFLITWLLLDEIETTGTIRLPAFYRRRAARLLPAFYAYLFGGLALLLLLHKPVPWGAIGAAALYVVNYYQALTGAPSHYLSHCWSLAVEEQFYLIWPIVLTLAMRRRWPLIPLLIGTIGAVWLLRLFLIFEVGASDEYLYRALETRADQLAWGCLLAVLLRKAPCCAFFDTLAQKWWSAPLIVAAIPASLTLLEGSVESKYTIAYALEPVLVMMLIPLVISAAARSGGSSRVLNAMPVVVVGQISYGIYLFHPFVIHPVKDALERHSVPASVSIAISILAVVLVAYVSFRFFEQPVRRRLRGHRKHVSAIDSSNGQPCEKSPL